MDERLSATTGTTGTIGPRPPTVRAMARLSACSGAACESCSPAGCRRCRPRRGRDRRRVADRGHARYDRPVPVAVRAVHYRRCRCRHRGGHAGGSGVAKDGRLAAPTVSRGNSSRERLRPEVAASFPANSRFSPDAVRCRTPGPQPGCSSVAVEVLAGSVVPHGGPRVGAPSRDLYPTRAFTPSRPVRAPAGWPLDGVGAPGRR